VSFDYLFGYVFHSKITDGVHNQMLLQIIANAMHKFHFGEIDFSPEPNLARGCRYVWDMVLKRKQGQRKIRARKIKAVAKAVGIENPLMAIECKVRRAFRVADDAYKKLKPKAPLMRTNWL
jgi:hypothetical protein